MGDGLKGDSLFSEWLKMLKCDACDVTVRLFTIALSALIFAFSVWYVSWAGRKILGVRHLKKSEKVRAHKVLIMAVTALNPAPEPDGSGISVVDKEDKNIKVALSGHIASDIHAFDSWKKPPNIQQMLRAMAPHLGALERVFLVGSKGAGGSYRILPQAEAVIRLYDKNLKISHHDEPEGIDFENIEKMTALFDQLILHAKRDGYRESDIIMDVTGGQKTASIAAAMATLERKDLEFQYVQTGAEHEVLSFDMVAEMDGEISG
ncbi:MAG: hypothetical protein WC091_16570 [Sulfuricellaceae bacterium]